MRILLPLSFIVLATLACFLWNNPFAESREHQELENYLEIRLPDDASNMELDYSLGRLHYINLSFEASPESVDHFVEHLCKEGLYRGYNPFDSVKYQGPDPFAVINDAASLPEVDLVQGLDFTYYSYSPNASETSYGNICRGSTGWMQLIFVDKSDPSVYKLIYEEPRACNTASVPLPCVGRGTNYINPNPYVPFMIAGLVQEGDGYKAISEMLCIESRDSYQIFSYTRYADYIDAEAELYINNDLRDTTHITKDFRLEPHDPIANPSPILFNYCYREDWLEGTNTISLVITRKDGVVEKYEVEFVTR